MNSTVAVAVAVAVAVEMQTVVAAGLVVSAPLEPLVQFEGHRTRMLLGRWALEELRTQMGRLVETPHSLRAAPPGRPRVEQAGRLLAAVLSEA